MKKKLLYFLITVIICTITLSIISFAHSGKTDSIGGHYDRSTGEYHYHHGYPAYQHTNGECPYDFKDNTNHQSGRTSSSPNDDSILFIILLGCVITAALCIAMQIAI